MSAPERIDVSLNEVVNPDTRPCRTVYGIAKALLNPESELSHRILRVAFRAIADNEGLSEAVDVAESSTKFDISSRLNQAKTEVGLRSIQSDIEGFVSRLRFSTDGSPAYTIDPNLIAKFVAELFLFAQTQLATGQPVSRELILEHMRLASLKDFGSLVPSVNISQSYPDTAKAAILIDSIRATDEPVALYDVGPFIAQYRRLHDPNDVALLFEANRNRLHLMSNSQKYFLIQELFGEIGRNEGDRRTHLLRELVTICDDSDPKIVYRLNEYFHSVVVCLLDQSTSPIAWEFLRQAKQKGILKSGGHILAAIGSMLEEKKPDHGALERLATQLIEEKFISEAGWQEFKQRNHQAW